MCVGDDWQSIYRFAGSDLDLFTRFENYFGYFELLKIEKTYRNSQGLIDLAGAFIMKNKKQYRKELISDKHLVNPVRFLFHQNSEAEAVLRAIDEIVDAHGGGDTVQVQIISNHGFFNAFYPFASSDLFFIRRGLILRYFCSHGSYHSFPGFF